MTNVWKWKCSLFPSNHLIEESRHCHGPPLQYIIVPPLQSSPCYIIVKGLHCKGGQTLQIFPPPNSSPPPPRSLGKLAEVKPALVPKRLRTAVIQYRNGKPSQQHIYQHQMDKKHFLDNHAQILDKEDDWLKFAWWRPSLWYIFHNVVQYLAKNY